MPGWAWILIVSVVVLVAIVGVWLFFNLRKLAQWKAEILEDGDLVVAWIVDVQPAEGLMWPIVLVLVSPDPDIPDDDMRALVAKVKKVRKRKPKDRDGAKVYQLTKKQIDAPGRNQLPEDFCNGLEIHSSFMDIGLDEEANLPKGGLDNEAFLVKLMWDNHPTIMVVPPRKKRNRSDD